MSLYTSSFLISSHRGDEENKILNPALDVLHASGGLPARPTTEQ